MSVGSVLLLVALPFTSTCINFSQRQCGRQLACSGDISVELQADIRSIWSLPAMENQWHQIRDHWCVFEVLQSRSASDGCAQQVFALTTAIYKGHMQCISATTLSSTWSMTCHHQTKDHHCDKVVVHSVNDLLSLDQGTKDAFPDLQTSLQSNALMYKVTINVLFSILVAPCQQKSQIYYGGSQTGSACSGRVRYFGGLPISGAGVRWTCLVASGL